LVAPSRRARLPVVGRVEALDFGAHLLQLRAELLDAPEDAILRDQGFSTTLIAPSSFFWNIEYASGASASGS
jgi:hypothetical protein